MNTTIKDRSTKVKRLAFCLSNKGKNLAKRHAIKAEIDASIYEAEALHNLRITFSSKGLAAKSFIQVGDSRVVFSTQHFASVEG